MLCPKCGSYMDDGARVCPVCGTRASAAAKNPTAAMPRPQDPTSSKPDLPMNWFNFLIYFALWAGGLLSILISVPFFTGSLFVFSDAPRLVSQLRASGKFFGLIFAACGVFVIYTRFRLASFKSDGPKCLYLSYAASAAASLAYTIHLADVFEDPFFVSFGVSAVTRAALIIVFTRIYFQRRTHMFKN